MRAYIREKEATILWELKGANSSRPYVEVWAKWHAISTYRRMEYINTLNPIDDEIKTVVATLTSPLIEQLNLIYNSVLNDRKEKDAAIISLDVIRDVFDVELTDEQLDAIKEDLPEVLQPIIDRVAQNWFKEKFGES